jgi:hypothetical protein
VFISAFLQMCPALRRTTEGTLGRTGTRMKKRADKGAFQISQQTPADLMLLKRVLRLQATYDDWWPGL